MLYGLDIVKDDKLVEAVRMEWPQRELGTLFHGRLDFGSTGSQVDVVFSAMMMEPLGNGGAHTAPPPLAIAPQIPDP